MNAGYGEIVFTEDDWLFGTSYVVCVLEGHSRLDDPRYKLWVSMGECGPQGKKGSSKDALQNNSVLDVILNFLGAFQEDLKPRATMAAMCFGEALNPLGYNVDGK